MTGTKEWKCLVLLGALYKKLCLQGILGITWAQKLRITGFEDLKPIYATTMHSYKPGHIPAYISVYGNSWMLESLKCKFYRMQNKDKYMNILCNGYRAHVLQKPLDKQSVGKYVHA